MTHQAAARLKSRSITPSRASSRPPLLEVGALAWIRKNLFGSWLDVILTVLGVVLVVGFVVGLIQWVVQEGNWFSIMYSLRTFTVGRFDTDMTWRVSAALLFVMVAIGVSVAAYTRRLSPVIPVILGIIAFVVTFVPSIINTLIGMPPQHLAAGNVGIASGTAQEVPIDRLAFIGREGETIEFRVAHDASSDETLAQMSGLVDRATNTLRNGADNRINALARVAEIDRLIAEDDAAIATADGRRTIGTLTANQRERLLTERGRIAYKIPEADAARLTEIETLLADTALTDEARAALVAEQAALNTPRLVTDVYAVNREMAQIAIYNADGSALLAPVLLDPQGVVTATLPQDGWYILEKTLPAETPGVSVLAVQGIYPVLQISDRFERIDNFELRVAPPRDSEDKTIRTIALLENRYRGTRPADEFFRLNVSPFLERIRETALFSIAAMIAGFALARLADGYFAPLAQPRLASRRVTNWLLIATPFTVFLLINGIDLFAMMTALAWVVAVYWAYQLGAMLYNAIGSNHTLRLGLMLAVGAATFGLVRFAPVLLYNGEPTATVFDVALALPVSLAFLLGSVTGSGDAPSVVRGRVIAVGVAVIALYGLPVLLARGLPTETASAINNILPYTDSNTWGGLLLSLIVTLYGIIFAFPLGIMLALGRRSKLPAIRYPCTVIIEMVRGTPFIVVLFAGQFLITLIHPSFQNIPPAYRALASTIIFVAAYLAENVRGGLQAIPPGQYEAGRALGLPEWQITVFITLPQALRAVIPALVGQFISLFKDTSLLEIVGLSDLSRGVALMVAQPEFSDSRREGLIFVTLIYFTISYAMAYVSRRMEESGAGAARRI